MQRKDLNYLKYLKYKNKYLNLRNQIGGGINEEVNQIMQEAIKFMADDKYQEALDHIDKQDKKHKELVFKRLKNEQNDFWYYLSKLIYIIEVDDIMQEANKMIATEQYQQAVDYIITQSLNRVFMTFRDKQPDDWKKLMLFIPGELKQL